MNNNSAGALLRAKREPKWKSPAFWGKWIWAFMRLVIIIGLSYMILHPIFLKVIASFMSVSDLTDPTVKYIPKEFTLEFLTEAIKRMNYFQAMLNTLIISLLVSVAQLAVSSMAGYGFARFKFRGRNLLFALTIFTLLVPFNVIQIPMFLRFRYFLPGVKLTGTFWPFVILSLTGLGLKNGIYIYLMKNFFSGLPKELEEAAFIDGAGMLKTFLQVVLPNARNMMLVVFIFSFTWQWTDYKVTSLFLGDVPILSKAVTAIASNTEGALVVTTLQNTACLLVILPLIIIFLFTQRQLIQGIERSGIVG